MRASKIGGNKSKDFNEAGGDFREAKGGRMENKWDWPQSGWLEPGGSLEARSQGFLIGPSRAKESGRERG